MISLTGNAEIKGWEDGYRGHSTVLWSTQLSWGVSMTFGRCGSDSSWDRWVKESCLRKKRKWFCISTNLRNLHGARWSLYFSKREQICYRKAILYSHGETWLLLTWLFGLSLWGNPIFFSVEPYNRGFPIQKRLQIEPLDGQTPRSLILYRTLVRLYYHIITLYYLTGEKSMAILIKWFTTNGFPSRKGTK